VLVNGNSASAAEIFTGAIKDYGIGTIIGTTTFGKGIVQKVFPLSDGSAVKLTVSKYYTPNGVCIHGEGIEPDITLEYDASLQTSGTYTKEEDNQLQKAIEVLKKEIK
jgi:carboxyl-terminal processing protease